MMIGPLPPGPPGAPRRAEVADAPLASVQPHPPDSALIVATVVSFVVGYAAIAWLLRYVSTNSYTPFVIYRIVLGGFTLAMLSAGVLTA